MPVHKLIVVLDKQRAFDPLLALLFDYSGRWCPESGLLHLHWLWLGLLLQEGL